MSLVFYHDIPKKYKLNRKYYYLTIIGSRDIEDSYIVREIIEKYIKNICKSENINNNNIVIITGGAKGVDTIAEDYAKRNNFSSIVIKPDWKRFGKSAGFKRNRNLVKYANGILAIIKNNSKGTKNSIEIAKKMKKKCTVINYNHYILEHYED